MRTSTAVYRVASLAALACVFLHGCGQESGTQTPDAPAQDAATSESSAPPAAPRVPHLPSPAVTLDFPFTLHQIDVADLNRDGLQDLTLASHVESRVETFYQAPDRSYAPSGPLPNVSFHPNGTVALSGRDPARAKLLVLNAETANALQVYQTKVGEPPAYIGKAPTPAPERSVVVDWPGWGETLAVIPKAGAQLHLFQTLAALPGDVPEPHAVALSPREQRRVAGLVTADLAGNGVEALLVTVPSEGRLVAVEPDGVVAVKARDIHAFEPNDQIHLIVPVDFDSDKRDDLFVLGAASPKVSLLLSSGLEQQFDISDAQETQTVAAQVSREPDGRLLLWVATQRALHVLTWPAARPSEPEHRVFPHPGLDHLRLAVADLDADGSQDLVIGSSISILPLSVVYGPLAPQLESIRIWLSQLEELHGAG